MWSVAFELNAVKRSICELMLKQGRLLCKQLTIFAFKSDVYPQNYNERSFSEYNSRDLPPWTESEEPSVIYESSSEVIAADRTLEKWLEEEFTVRSKVLSVLQLVFSF
jgi:hypothetical protein